MEKEVESLAAQLLALQVLVSAVLRSHPAPESVLAEIPPLAQATRDAILPTSLPDSLVARFECELELLSLGLQR